MIPPANAGPLRSDFELIAQAAKSGDGSCTNTEEAIERTERDFAALPATVDSGLRSTLHLGIQNLRTRALALCQQPLAQATVTSSTAKTAPATTPATTPTTTDTTPATAPATTPPATTPSTTAPTTSTPGGGTAAPKTEGGEEESSGAGKGEGSGGTRGGRGGAGGTGAGEGTSHQ